MSERLVNVGYKIQEARSELENKFRLSNNADILLSHADELYTQCRFKERLEVTTKLLELDMRVFLFTFKVSTMDSHCGPTWVGFGHTFAIESEHDQAITAYSTTVKLYSGSHLSTLFIGMQHLQAKNLLSAEEYLFIRSIGIKRVGYAQSVDFFKNALNLGELDIAESYFQRVVSVSPPNADALTALGYIYYVKEEFEEYYHEALSICPYDPITHDLLSSWSIAKRILK
ncbi:TPR-like protein [Gigaspora margarita]|uniref:TPR-like protein n=1 Tax=Gigaspora margarita TaxID=4874 RepID=A0A8H4A3L7_GIGMA|nr:TPR-like protein [Gigaspora margarita]